MRHIRGYIYICNAVLGVFVYFYVQTTVGPGSLMPIELTELYGLIATIYLFCALLPSPLYAVFPRLPGKALVTRARRAIGVSTFCFAFIHTLIGFFQLLDGFAGLSFLNGYELYDLAFAAIALFILFLMFATSNDYSVRILGPWWKRLHRFVYLAGLLVFLHILLFGNNFMFFEGPYYATLVTAVALLLSLECVRATKKLRRHLEDTGLLFCVALTGLVFVWIAWTILIFNGTQLGNANMNAMGMPTQNSR